MNLATMAMVRLSGRSWWSVEYATRTVNEWDTAPSKIIRTPLTVDSKRSVWEDLTKTGIKRAFLLCPDGHVGAVEQVQDGRLFQFKIGFAEFGMMGQSPRNNWCDAHVLGLVINPEGDCQCWAWEPLNWRLVSFPDSIWNFQYRKLGRLAVAETFQLKGVG